MDTTKIIVAGMFLALPVFVVAQDPPTRPVFPLDLPAPPVPWKSTAPKPPNVIAPIPRLAAAPMRNAHLRFQVLVVDDSRAGQIEDLIREIFPEGSHMQGGSTLEVETEIAETFLRRMIEDGHARVVSRPQMVVRAGRTAQIEVGERVEPVPPGKELDPDTPRPGLTLKCQVERVEDPDRMQLSIKCARVTADKERNIEIEGGEVIRSFAEEFIETTIEVTSGKTVTLMSPKKMLVFITPAWVSKQPKPPVTPARFRAPRVVAHPPRRPNVLDDSIRIRQAIADVSGEAAISVRIQRDQIEIEVVVDDDSKARKVAEAISAIGGIEVDSIRLQTLGRGSKLELAGRRIGSPVRSTADELRAIRLEIDTLRRAIEELSETVRKQ